MAFRDSWHRALVYFGLAEERDPYVEDDDPYEPEAELEDRYRERPNVRRLGSRRRRDEFDDIFADDDVPGAADGPAALRAPRRATAAATCACTSSSPRASTTPSRSRTSSRTRSRSSSTSRASTTDLSKRLIDFASGLTYALDGGMQRIADKVFMLTPRNVEISAEERAELIEKGFFNQS